MHVLSEYIDRVCQFHWVLYPPLLIIILFWLLRGFLQISVSCYKPLHHVILRYL